MTTNNMVLLAQNSVLSQLPVKNSPEVIKLYLFLGIAELYKRFNLLVKSEAVRTVPETAMYELTNSDINQVLAIYNSEGEELLPMTVINSRNYDYKQLNYRTFIIIRPKDELLTFVYKASPADITDLDAELVIPPDMEGALLDYIGYMGHSTINKDNSHEATLYLQKFERDCSLLEQCVRFNVLRLIL
jgi:hypothetical protein